MVLDNSLNYAKIDDDSLPVCTLRQDLDDQQKLASAEIFPVKYLTSLNEFLVKMRQLFCRRGAADPR